MMFARFGEPVWLVGSAIDKADAGDVDVRIVLPDDKFGVWFGDWQNVKETDVDLWDDRARLWAYVMGKQAAWVVRNCKIAIDFQIQPACWVAVRYLDRPRIRLDTVEDQTMREDHRHVR